MSWDTIEDNAPKGGGDWFKLLQGDNRVRIVSTPQARGLHWIQEDRKSYPCLGKEEGCQYCAENRKSSVKFLFYVIDRKDPTTADGQPKIQLAEFGYMIAEQLKNYQSSDEYGFDKNALPPYDVTINRTGEDLNTTYTVIPARQDTPLTNEEQQAVVELKPLSEVKESLKGKKEPAQTSSETQMPTPPPPPLPEEYPPLPKF